MHQQASGWHLHLQLLQSNVPDIAAAQSHATLSNILKACPDCVIFSVQSKRGCMGTLIQARHLDRHSEGGAIRMGCIVPTHALDDWP